MAYSDIERGFFSEIPEIKEWVDWQIDSYGVSTPIIGGDVDQLYKEEEKLRYEKKKRAADRIVGQRAAKECEVYFIQQALDDKSFSTYIVDSGELDNAEDTAIAGYDHEVWVAEEELDEMLRSMSTALRIEP